MRDRLAPALVRDGAKHWTANPHAIAEREHAVEVAALRQQLAVALEALDDARNEVMRMHLDLDARDGRRAESEGLTCPEHPYRSPATPTVRRESWWQRIRVRSVMQGAVTGYAAGICLVHAHYALALGALTVNVVLELAAQYVEHWRRSRTRSL